MPLHDHFHGPWDDLSHWEGFHASWATMMARQLNGAVLPRHYRAEPHVHLGSFVEADLATFESDRLSSDLHTEGSNGVKVWTPSAAIQTLEVDFPAQDVFEVRVLDTSQGTRVVAVVELVSPGNKDRPEHRNAFVAKCVAYLQEQIGVVVVDIVTSRHANFHRELLEMFSLAEEERTEPDLYAVSYRSRKEKEKWFLDTWPTPLFVGQKLPTMPLWLSSRFSVGLDLEESYEETQRMLRLS